MAAIDFGAHRYKMVEEQIALRGISDEAVLSAMRKVRRDEFVPAENRMNAYNDYPLPIGEGQTISQPYMVALMTQCLALKGGERTLEIGTGSGYQTAVLAEIAAEVYSVERVDGLAARARDTLIAMGYRNCFIRTGDGTLGWEDRAPYDAIIVTAGAPVIPDSLIRQLNGCGRLVIPVGSEWAQMLVIIEKTGFGIKKTDVCGCVFVPLIGKEGWPMRQGS